NLYDFFRLHETEIGNRFEVCLCWKGLLNAWRRWRQASDGVVLLRQRWTVPQDRHYAKGDQRRGVDHAGDEKEPPCAFSLFLFCGFNKFIKHRGISYGGPLPADRGVEPDSRGRGVGATFQPMGIRKEQFRISSLW